MTEWHFPFNGGHVIERRTSGRIRKAEITTLKGSS
jgi:hypothetical protein